MPIGSSGTVNNSAKDLARLFILAGGKGERLFPFSNLIPKCLVPVAGKPCARWIVEDAVSQGFTDIVLCINRWDESHFRYEFRDLVFLQYSVSEEPCGTVGELLCAKPYIEGTFIVRYGDDLTGIDYAELVRSHKERKAAVTLAVTTEFVLPVGVVEVGGEGRVINFIEKPTLGKPSWVGIVVMEPQILNYFAVGEDLGRDTIPKMLKAGEKTYCFMTNNHWYDVGNVEHWRKADEHFRKTLTKGKQSS